MYSELQRGQQTTVCKNSILIEKTDTYVYNLYINLYNPYKI